ncbi:MAG: serine/threonine-protein kinase [Myxococcota bacterium]
MDAHLGPYRLVRWLGRGGMAEAQLALRLGAEGFERRVVVKCLHEHLCGNPEAERRFTEEALLGSQLDHSLIVKVLDLGRSQRRPYMALEYVDGLDLRSVLAWAGPLPLTAALYVARQVARALHYAHTLRDGWGQPLGIVHRDVTPSNILLSRSGEVKLTDFGVAKALGREATKAGIIKGKYAYMSPEQVDQGDVNPRSDLFSLGSVLYEALTNARLFQGRGPLAILDQVRAATLPPLPASLSERCPELNQVLSAALARDWRVRYPNARTMAQTLSQALVNLGELEPDVMLAEHVQRASLAALERPHQGAAAGDAITLNRELEEDDISTRDWWALDVEPPSDAHLDDSVGDTTNNY